MGLFDKKYCDICGEKIGLLGNRKLEDGNLCKECASKLSPWFNERRHSSIEDIKAQLEYREQNKQKIGQFHVTRTLGSSWKVLLDENNRWFTVTRSTNPGTAENPDILNFTDITGCRMEVDEDRDEIYRSTNNGNRESYNPPRYKYSYNFDIIINVSNPYFDEIKFRVNESTIYYEPQQTVQISLFGGSTTTSNANPENCVEYCRCRDIANEICRELDRVRGVGGGYAQQPYGVPQQPYGAPQQPYGAPQQPYGAPQQPYGAPQQPYGAPQQQPYGAPQQQPYGAPQQQPYGAPQQPYGAPQQAAPMANGAWVCPSCGTSNDGGRFCQGCGAAK